MKEREKINDQDFVKPEHLEGSHASYSALPLIQNQQKFYFVTIPVSEIFPYCYVVRREENPKAGFQRELNTERALDIAKYLDNSVGSIPTNIVLSAQPDAELIYNSKMRTVRFKRIPKAFLVLDGQHRLFGYGLTKKKHRVPVAIYEGLNRREESTLFIDINTNQRGVPAALLLDIKQIAERENETEAMLRKIFDKLASDADSPLNGLMSASRSLPGKISRVTFNRAVSDILHGNLITRLSEDRQYMLLKNYLKALDQIVEPNGILCKSSYFEAFWAIFEDTLQVSMARHRNIKFESLLDVLGSLKNVDLQHLATHGRTKITKSSIVPVLKAAIAAQVDVSEDMV